MADQPNAILSLILSMPMKVRAYNLKHEQLCGIHKIMHMYCMQYDNNLRSTKSLARLH